MSQNLNITYTTEKVRVAKEVVPANFVATLTPLNADGTPTGASPLVGQSATPSISLTSIVDGIYQAVHGRVDSTGASIGRGFTDIITIANNTVTVEQLVDGVASVAYALEQVPTPPTAAA